MHTIFRIGLLTLIGAIHGDFVASTSAQNWSIQLFAAPIDVVEGSPGHAFLCLSFASSSAKHEDCYGFYPTNKNKGFISGPGVVQNEFRKRPERFSKVTISLSAQISEEQRRILLKEIEQWNLKSYSLTKENCADFVYSAVQAIGWKVPRKTANLTPEKLLEELKRLNP